MDIKTLAEQYNDYIIDRRRYYHTCPELSGEEKNTRAHLKEDLEALGITDIHELETCYGLTATIHGGKPGKTVALRADIDALPVKEETGLPFASHNEGKMHACGHDNHMAMLLGAAKILNEVKDELSGDVLPGVPACGGDRRGRSADDGGTRAGRCGRHLRRACLGYL